MNKKPSNPKDIGAASKVPFDRLPMVVVAEAAVALHEGDRKYGYHNWRKEGVQSGVYISASLRHILDWQEGQDIDPDSGMSHITKAIAGLMVLRDGMIQGNWVDTRPRGCSGWIEALNAKTQEINERYPDRAAPFLADGRPPRPYCGTQTTEQVKQTLLTDCVGQVKSDIQDVLSQEDIDTERLAELCRALEVYQGRKNDCEHGPHSQARLRLLRDIETSLRSCKYRMYQEMAKAIPDAAVIHDLEMEMNDLQQERRNISAQKS